MNVLWSKNLHWSSDLMWRWKKNLCPTGFSHVWTLTDLLSWVKLHAASLSLLKNHSMVPPLPCFMVQTVLQAIFPPPHSILECTGFYWQYCIKTRTYPVNRLSPKLRFFTAPPELLWVFMAASLIIALTACPVIWGGQKWLCCQMKD